MPIPCSAVPVHTGQPGSTGRPGTACASTGHNAPVGQRPGRRRVPCIPVGICNTSTARDTRARPASRPTTRRARTRTRRPNSRSRLPATVYPQPRRPTRSRNVPAAADGVPQTDLPATTRVPPPPTYPYPAPQPRKSQRSPSCSSRRGAGRHAGGGRRRHLRRGKVRQKGQPEPARRQWVGAPSASASAGTTSKKNPPPGDGLTVGSGPCASTSTSTTDARRAATSSRPPGTTSATTSPQEDHAQRPPGGVHRQRVEESVLVPGRGRRRLRIRRRQAARLQPSICSSTSRTKTRPAPRTAS